MPCYNNVHLIEAKKNTVLACWWEYKIRLKHLGTTLQTPVGDASGDEA